MSSSVDGKKSFVQNRAAGVAAGRSSGLARLNMRSTTTCCPPSLPTSSIVFAKRCSSDASSSRRIKKANRNGVMCRCSLGSPACSKSFASLSTLSWTDLPEIIWGYRLASLMRNAAHVESIENPLSGNMLVDLKLCSIDDPASMQVVADC